MSLAKYGKHILQLFYATNQRREKFRLVHVGSLWVTLGHFGPICATLGNFGCLGHFGVLWSALYHSGLWLFGPLMLLLTFFLLLDLSIPCSCADWHGCIMKSSLSGEDGIQVTYFYIKLFISFEYDIHELFLSIILLIFFSVTSIRHREAVKKTAF